MNKKEESYQDKLEEISKIKSINNELNEKNNDLNKEINN